MVDMDKKENIIYKPMDWFIVSRTGPDTVTTLSSEDFGYQIVRRDGISNNKQKEKFEQIKNMIVEASANVTELSSHTDYPQMAIFSVGNGDYVIEFSPKSLRDNMDATIALIVDIEDLNTIRLNEDDVYSIIGSIDEMKKKKNQEIMLPFSDEYDEHYSKDNRCFLKALLDVHKQLKDIPELNCPISFHRNEQMLGFKDHLMLANMLIFSSPDYYGNKTQFYIGDTPPGEMFNPFIEQFPTFSRINHSQIQEHINAEIRMDYPYLMRPGDKEYQEYIAEASAAYERNAKAYTPVISDTYQPKHSELSFDINNGVFSPENYKKLLSYIDVALNYKGLNDTVRKELEYWRETLFYEYMEESKEEVSDDHPGTTTLNEVTVYDGNHTRPVVSSEAAISEEETTGAPTSSEVVISDEENPSDTASSGVILSDEDHPGATVLNELSIFDEDNPSDTSSSGVTLSDKDHPGATVSDEVVISKREPKRRDTKSAVSPTKDSIVSPTKESDDKAQASVDEPQNTNTGPVSDISSEIEEEPETTDTHDFHDYTFKDFIKDLFNIPTKESKVKSSIDNNKFLKKVTIKKVLKVLKSIRSLVDKTIQHLEESIEDEEEERIDD